MQALNPNIDTNIDLVTSDLLLCTKEENRHTILAVLKYIKDPQRFLQAVLLYQSSVSGTYWTTHSYMSGKLSLL